MKPELASIIRTILSASDNKVVRDGVCDRRFMIVDVKEPVR